MRFKNLDLNLLVALDAMLAEGSITKAARTVHLTQSAMSAALARLREYFQDELLVQVGRQMELTPRALLLKDAVRDLLTQAENVLSAEPSLDPATYTRRFSLLVSDYTNTLLMPRVLALAREEAPRVTFDLLPQQSDHPPQEMLERGAADLLLIVDRYCSSEHPRQEVLFDELVCMAPVDHPTIQGEINLEQYCQLGHVVMQPGRNLRAIDALLLGEAGVERNEEVRTFSFLALPQLLGKERITTVQRRVAEYVQRTLGPQWQILPLPVTLPPICVAMQWHRHRKFDSGLQWLRELVVRAAQGA